MKTAYNTVWYENKKLRVKVARLSSQLSTANGNLESVIQSSGGDVSTTTTLFHDLWAAKATIKSLERASAAKSAEIARLSQGGKPKPDVEPAREQQGGGAIKELEELRELYTQTLHEAREAREECARLQTSRPAPTAASTVHAKQEGQEAMSAESFKELLNTHMSKVTQAGHPQESRAKPRNPRGVILCPEDWLEAVVEHKVNRAQRAMAADSVIEITQAPGSSGRRPPDDLVQARSQMGKLRHVGRPSTQVEEDGLVTFAQMLEFEKGLWHVHLRCLQELVVTEARVERHSWKHAAEGTSQPSPRPQSVHNVHQAARVPVPPPSKRERQRPASVGSLALKTALESDLGGQGYESELQRAGEVDGYEGYGRHGAMTHRGGTVQDDRMPTQRPPRLGTGGMDAVPLLDLGRMRAEEEDEEDLDDIPLDAEWASEWASRPKVVEGKLALTKLGLPPGLATESGAQTRRESSQGVCERSQKEEEDTYAETESARKLKKIRFFSQQCSQVLAHLFVSGDKVAQDREILMQNQISRVLNCASTYLPCHHRNDATIQYYSLPLLDSPTEQISRYFYCVLTTMEEIAQQGQRLLVHCHQGVSRSCTMAIAYIMWKQDMSYEQAFRSLREARAICQPNIGFICELIDWDKRRRAALNGTATAPEVYVAFPSNLDAQDSYPGTPWRVHKDHELLKDRELLAQDACVVVHHATKVLLWEGPQCSDVVRSGAVRHAEHLQNFEGARPWCSADAATAEFQAALRLCGLLPPPTVW